MLPFTALPALAVSATQLAIVSIRSVVVAPLPFAVGSLPAVIAFGAPVAFVTLQAVAVFPSLGLAPLLLQLPWPIQLTAVG